MHGPVGWGSKGVVKEIIPILQELLYNGGMLWREKKF